ncbi:ATP-dependent Clp protease proteolytic subunit, partial [Pseudonocardia bannensis]|uniref:ATP-dependent Clp protease proteolytic subunit n=1 Tax=Pseudonocardia bannensis TaxID=630973 RepID=UPI001B7D234D
PTPREPRRTPWQPEPRPAAPLSAPSQWTAVETGQDWLAERLLDRRMVTLAGRLDPDAANRATASLALLDASADDPVQLRLCDVDADLDVAVTVLDTLDLMGVPVHATCLGKLTGAAVAILAVADRRIAAPHAILHLREPRTRHCGHPRDITAHAEHHERLLRMLQERIAGACRRPADTVAADMRAGRVLTAEEARGYGLVDAIIADRTRRSPARS